MFFAITDHAVFTGKNLEKLNEKMNAKLEEHEFKALGSDFIVYLTVENFDFVQDKKRLSLIPMERLYRHDNFPKLIWCLQLLMLFIILVRG